ncbi:ABC transporter substrate-binding protein [Rhizobiaceae bacterium n13]|uniref:ABC transporter substrate-binding protein n=1 Tax=Ferirhizobium litorale TaxID=2927786 RepID=A0AAE3QCG3_9HYPH|nr:ABC transporter substrate-binding protein [Fererhizobium litorale]MDI7860705.1 ABC transporter substrate-binding protein [Fererhizobium litorale]MDI7920853.1 ABC transporter substrate-binding protein [Fererhizobium litorale]
MLGGTAFHVVAEETPPVDTSRLVSVGGALTEVIYALGEQHRLVARDSTSTYPAEATKIADIGYMRALSPEGVLAVNPSAIVAIEGSGPPEALAVLKGASVPMTTVPETYDRDGILTKIRAVGHLLGVEDKAKALEDEVAAELDAAIADAAGRPEGERKRVMFVLSLQGGKVLASGTGTAADGVLKLAGLTNAFSDFPGYKPVTDEAIIDAKPDVILMMNRGDDHGAGAEQVFANPALALTPAAASKALVRMDGLHLLGFGPRTASAVRELNAEIYGQADGTE